MKSPVTRREFVKSSAAMAAAVVTGPLIRTATARPSAYRLKVGVIGCGGRGAGAAINMLEASPDVEITALADVFADRLNGCRKSLDSRSPEFGDRVKVGDDRCFSGFDAYKQLLETEVDVVICATPPHFRPIHLAAAVERGKHAFVEKPVAVDPVGIRSVLASAAISDEKGLSIVAGTQRRHETCYIEAMQRISDGAIGKIASASCYWNQGGLWMNPRKPEWSDMEWQLRNWLYFTWLSGDHIVEQHVHNIDVINWSLGTHPIRATGIGGRQVRTSPDYGHVFDHFTIEFEYPDGQTLTSMSRQIDGCSGRVEEVIRGCHAICTTSSGRAKIAALDPKGFGGGPNWNFTGENNNPYLQEQIDLIGAITSGHRLNEARQVAESTMTAIMGRMSAYTGKAVTWEQAMNSKLDLSPPNYAMGDLAVAEVAVPGRTPLV